MSATTSITALDPTCPPPADQTIRGVVSLLWPYSSSTRQCALLLADPDFRSRGRRRQVRIRFVGASATAVAEGKVGIGDEVLVQLRGAQWTEDSCTVTTPGKNVEGELLFRGELSLQLLRKAGGRDEEEVRQEIRVQESTPPPEDPSPLVNETPARQNRVASLRLSLGGLGLVPIYSSPAFVRRQRLSGEHLGRGRVFDPFAELEHELEEEQPRKRQRISDVGTWRFAGDTPSPEKEVEEEDPHDSMEVDGNGAAPHSTSEHTMAIVDETPMRTRVTAENEAENPPLVPRILDFGSHSNAASFMPPPTHPTLKLPEDPFVHDPARARGQNEPTTPKLQPVPSHHLPLPSPFPVEPVNHPFEPQLPVAEEVSGREKQGQAERVEFDNSATDGVRLRVNPDIAALAEQSQQSPESETVVSSKAVSHDGAKQDTHSLQDLLPRQSADPESTTTPDTQFRDDFDDEYDEEFSRPTGIYAPGVPLLDPSIPGYNPNHPQYLSDTEEDENLEELYSQHIQRTHQERLVQEGIRFRDWVQPDVVEAVVEDMGEKPATSAESVTDSSDAEEDRIIEEPLIEVRGRQDSDSHRVTSVSPTMSAEREQEQAVLDRSEDTPTTLAAEVPAVPTDLNAVGGDSTTSSAGEAQAELQRPKTPPPNHIQRLFGFSTGPSDLPPSQQKETPQSEKERIMKKTFSSLFGFKASPSPEKDRVPQLSMFETPTPAGAVARESVMSSPTMSAREENSAFTFSPAIGQRSDGGDHATQDGFRSVDTLNDESIKVDVPPKEFHNTHREILKAEPQLESRSEAQLPVSNSEITSLELERIQSQQTSSAFEESFHFPRDSTGPEISKRTPDRAHPTPSVDLTMPNAMPEKLSPVALDFSPVKQTLLDDVAIQESGTGSVKAEDIRSERSEISSMSAIETRPNGPSHDNCELQSPLDPALQSSSAYHNFPPPSGTVSQLSSVQFTDLGSVDEKKDDDEAGIAPSIPTSLGPWTSYQYTASSQITPVETAVKSRSVSPSSHAVSHDGDVEMRDEFGTSEPAPVIPETLQGHTLLSRKQQSQEGKSRDVKSEALPFPSQDTGSLSSTQNEARNIAEKYRYFSFESVSSDDDVENRGRGGDSLGAAPSELLTVPHVRNAGTSEELSHVQPSEPVDSSTSVLDAADNERQTPSFITDASLSSRQESSQLQSYLDLPSPTESQSFQTQPREHSQPLETQIATEVTAALLPPPVVTTEGPKVADQSNSTSQDSAKPRASRKRGGSTTDKTPIRRSARKLQAGSQPENDGLATESVVKTRSQRTATPETRRLSTTSVDSNSTWTPSQKQPVRRSTRKSQVRVDISQSISEEPEAPVAVESPRKKVTRKRKTRGHSEQEENMEHENISPPAKRANASKKTRSDDLHVSPSAEKVDEPSLDAHSDQVPPARIAAARKSFTSRLGQVPEVISTWFSPKGSLRQRTSDESGAADHDGPAMLNRKPPAGITTDLGYYTTLSSLEEKLNPASQPGVENTVDVIAIVTQDTKTPERAKGGPKDYYTVLRITDPSIARGESFLVEVFRPWHATLPVAEAGDVVLLRGFAVKSRKRQPYLLSGEASAWLVWRYAGHHSPDARLRPGSSGSAGSPRAKRRASLAGGATEETKGPPVEVGDAERARAGELRAWYLSGVPDGRID